VGCNFLRVIEQRAQMRRAFLSNDLLLAVSFRRLADDKRLLPQMQEPINDARHFWSCLGTSCAGIIVVYRRYPFRHLLSLPPPTPRKYSPNHRRLTLVTFAIRTAV
jgi:hypothetical protein